MSAENQPNGGANPSAGDPASTAPENAPGSAPASAPGAPAFPDRSRQNLVYLILAVAFASVFYRITALHHLEQTSLLFIGTPTVLAILVVLMPKAKSITGSILKATTVAQFFSKLIIKNMLYL